MAPRESHRPANRTRHRQAGESSRRNQHRKRRSNTRRPATASDESRDERRSQALSSGALAQLNRDNERRKHKAEKESRRRKHRGEHYQEVDTTPRSTPRKPRKHDKHKKRRVVSGAVMEEGRAGRSGLRGGGSWGADDFDKEEFYRRPKKKSRKKLCECNELPRKGRESD